MSQYCAGILCVGVSPLLSVRVVKPIVNLHENRDAGVDSQYLAVSEKFSFFDLSLGADCIGVLALCSVSAPADCIGFEVKSDAFLYSGLSRLYRCFAESALFATFPNLRFSVFTPMSRVRDPRVFRDDSRAVLDFLNFFTGFCRFLLFLHFLTLLRPRFSVCIRCTG